MGVWKRRLKGSYLAIAVLAAAIVALFTAGLGGAIVAFLGVLAVLLAAAFIVYVVVRRIYDRFVHSEPLYRGGGGG